MLDDLAKIPVVVNVCVPCVQASCTVLSATCSAPGTWTVDSGVAMP